MDPLVLGLDVSSGFIAPKQVLQGTEIDERRGGGNFCRVAVRIAREELPAIKIHMGFEVGLPRICHCGLERHHQHPLGIEFLGELIGGEGFAKTHLGIPQKAGSRFVFLIPPDGIEVVKSLFHRFSLFPPHPKLLMVRAGEGLAGSQLREHSLHIRQCAAHPFQFRVSEFLFDERGAHFMIGEGLAVVQFDFVILDVGGLELLGHALFHIARGLADLKQARVRLIVNRVGVDARTGLRLRR